MKLTIHMPDTLDAENIEVSSAKEGCTNLASYDGVRMTPIFYTKNSLVSGPSITLSDEKGRILCAGVLRISGRTGQIIFEKRLKSVTPAIEGSE